MAARDRLMFPARAGMSRIVALCLDFDTDVPRASGDEPDGAILTYLFEPCSPRERG